MLNWVTHSVFLSTIANAAIRSDRSEIPRNTKSLTVDGMSQAEHTLDSLGRFKHPFADQTADVQSIYYPESGTISTKLHRKPAPSRHSEKSREE